MSKYVLRWPCSGKRHDLMFILLSILTIVSYTEKKRKHSGVSELEKVPYSNIQDNQLDLPLTCFPLWKYQSQGEWLTLPTALWWEGNLRATYHIIDMSLFAWLVYLKSFKEMRNPGGPRETLGKAVIKQTWHPQLWGRWNQTTHPSANKTQSLLIAMVSTLANGS